jgi:peptidoglycan/LPS O-acetylase OafA/YrhL
VKKLIVVAEASEPERNNFDAIRLAMALLVVWSHSFALHLGSERAEWISLLLAGVYNAGNLGVMAFFVISGFLITQSYVRSKTIGRFLEKRVRRIYPGYLVATTLCAFVVVPLFAAKEALNGLEVGLNLLLQNYFPPSSAFAANPYPLAVNGSLWSIPFEFWCYLGVAALGLLSLATRRWFLVATLLVLMLARVACDVAGKTPSLGYVGVIFGWPYLWTKIGPSFLLGMIAYALRQQLPRSLGLLAGLTIASIAACHLNANVANMLVAPTLAYGVFMVAFTDRVALHEATRYGDFSYGTYLYAFPIQQMLAGSVGRGWSMPIFIAASFVLALLSGVLSWHLVERWFLPRRIAGTDVGRATAGLGRLIPAFGLKGGREIR